MDHVQICIGFLFISSNSLDTNKIITNSTMQFLNTVETVIGMTTTVTLVTTPTVVACSCLVVCRFSSVLTCI